MTKNDKIKALNKEIRDLTVKLKDLEPLVTEFYRLQNKSDELNKKRIKLRYGPEIYKALY